MPTGTNYKLYCHENASAVLVFDSLYQGPGFSHDVSVVAPFTTVVWNDFSSTPNDGWIVNFFFPNGTDPGTSYTIQDFLDDATTAINAAFPSSGVGPNLPSPYL